MEDLELTFGLNGKPNYVQGPKDKPVSIIQKLERKLGKGGFEFHLEASQMPYGLPDFGEDDDEYIDEEDMDIGAEYTDYEEVKEDKK